MRKTLSLALLSTLAVIASACGQPATPKGQECTWPAGAASAAPGTCPENCEWDAKTNACVPHRGIILDNATAPDAGAPTTP